MRKTIVGILAVILLVLFASPGIEAAGGIVYRLPVQGEIDNGMVKYLQRGFAEAAEGGADLIVLELDTPGGYLEAAEKIANLMLDSDINTVALVNKRALSAGAYLALACQEIYMTPGSTFGAAEARIAGSREPADEKVLSSWEAAMRSAAENSGRDPLIAAAMVRRDISVEGLVAAGELLTFTPAEALEWDFSEGTVNNMNQLLSTLNWQGATLRTVEPNRSEQFIGVITDPILATLLLTIGLAALVIELFTAGFGVFGFISISAFVLYFGGSILSGQAGYEVILFFILGLVLMIVEAFIPGFGIFGVSGLVSLIAAIILAAPSLQMGVLMLLVSIVIAAVIIYIAFRYLNRSGFLDYFILRNRADSKSGYTSHSDQSDLLNAEGETITVLRPSGTALIGGRRVDVISEGEFIPANTPVKVINTTGGRIMVRRV